MALISINQLLVLLLQFSIRFQKCMHGERSVILHARFALRSGSELPRLICSGTLSSRAIPHTWMPAICIAATVIFLLPP